MINQTPKSWQNRSTWVSPNYGLVCWLMIILGLGSLFIYSASIALPDARKAKIASEFFYLQRHLFSISLGIIALLCVKEIPIKVWERWSPKLFIFAIFLLIVVLLPGVGRWINGAKRWIPLGVINFQPSELAKLAAILYASNFVVRKLNVMSSFTKGVLPLLIALSAVGVLLLLEPDMGAFLVITLVIGGIVFLGGAKLRLFILLSIVAILTFVTIIYTSPWRRDRIFAYLSPWDEAYVLTKGYQLTLSLIAFGRGGWFGEGLGASIQKLHYLPEAHTDFIMAVIGEELGLMGVTFILLLFYYFIYKSFTIGRTALQFQRTFAGLVAQGIGLWIGIQVFINMGVNLGLLPTKGLTLPFISYGGSAILMNCIAVGILMRINQENSDIMQGRG
jgi:cell division protein FtsW